MRNSLTIGITGTGGDGVVVLGSFLQKLTAGQGYFSQMPRYYGARIRGGGSAVKLSLDIERLPFPKDSIDILVCFDWEKYLDFKHELALEIDTLVFYENAPPSAIDLPERSFQVPFSRVSKESTGATRDKNIVALGLLKRILALPDNRVRQIIAEDESLRLLRDNLAALEAGELILPEIAYADFRLAPAQRDSGKLILHGSAAMARAAIRAGCQAFFCYPITPSAEIMQDMQGELSRGKGVFLQAEDEIAAAGLVIGSSLAGARAMTSTSGPGLDLMTEMMGLATVAEIPMVIIDVQRCGPSTGIPSKSEQSDLNHAVYGGHGDAPRVVMAPYDIQGCYRSVIDGINIAQHFQTLVIILSDQWLGQTFVAIDDDFLGNGYPIDERKKPASEDRNDYHRYRFAEDFISPMSVVGDEGFTYQTSGLTHDEEGAPAFDFETHQTLHEKRWKKLVPLSRRDDLVQIFGKENCSKGIITWGSSAQVVMETVNNLGIQNEVKICVPELIHPLPRKIEDFLSSIEKLLVVEMNYSGQLHRYLRSQVDLPRRSQVYARAGGRPFSISELTGPITELVR